MTFLDLDAHVRFCVSTLASVTQNVDTFFTAVGFVAKLMMCQQFKFVCYIFQYRLCKCKIFYTLSQVSF